MAAALSRLTEHEDEEPSIGYEDIYEEQSIVRHRSGAVLVHGKAAGRPGFPIKLARPPMRVERGRKRRGEERTLVKG